MHPTIEDFVGDLFKLLVGQVGLTRHQFERLVERALRLFRNHRLRLAHTVGEIPGEFIRSHFADDIRWVDG